MRLIHIIFLIIVVVMISFGDIKAVSNPQSGTVQIEAFVPEISTQIEEVGFKSLAGTIKKFSVENQLYEYKNLVFYTEFQNTGEQDLKPQGYIIIRNWFGKEIERLDFNHLGVVSPVGEATTYENIWLSQNLIGAGKYSASLVVNYGTSQNLSSQIHFWIFPWKVMGISLSFLILIWLIHKITVIELVEHRRMGWKQI